MKDKILVTDFIDPLFMEEMKAYGYQVDYHPEIDQKGILAILNAYLGVVINSKTQADKDFIDHGVRLSFIARMGSGMEIIDRGYAEGKGITCINSPEGNRNAVAEHALGMLLCLMNNIAVADKEVKNHQWNREPNRGIELSGKTVGILGYGNTGSTFAKRLSGFDIRILAYDKYRSGFSGGRVEECDMDEIFEYADVLSLHLPLTDETAYLVNKEFLESFKKDILIINTSRGKIVKTGDLLSAMKSGKVLGACLDVLENEKLASLNKRELKVFEELIQQPNVVLTPHIAGWTIESRQKIARVLVKKIKEILPEKH